MSRPPFLAKVFVIGCGNIAGGFDADRPPEALPLSHAGAYARHGGFELAACMDPDEARRSAFVRRWGVAEGHARLPDPSGLAGRFDVVSICSPTAFHAEHLAWALACRPRLIFCEKPLTPSLAESLEWVGRCERAGVPMAVNHTRRWAPDVVRLRDELRTGAWGELRSVSGHYNKGVLNNGAHMIDLLHCLAGPLDLLSAGAAVHDFWPDDPSIPAMLRSRSGVPVQLGTGHAGDYSLFELQLVTSTAVVSMEEGGMSWRVRRAVESASFKGYRTLDAGECRAGEYPQAMLAAVGNLHDHLTSGRPLASDGRSALEAQRLCAAIRDLASAADPSVAPTPSSRNPQA
jgi:predicted dehydrogenase